METKFPRALLRFLAICHGKDKGDPPDLCVDRERGISLLTSSNATDISNGKGTSNGLREVHLSGDASNRLSYLVGLILRQCCKLSEMLGTNKDFEHVEAR